jgi:hypothetical protein
MSCEKCGGAGSLDCPHCGGSGDYNDGKGEVRHCKACGKNGLDPGQICCPACNDDGGSQEDDYYDDDDED